jgi:hypothetical protein
VTNGFSEADLHGLAIERRRGYWLTPCTVLLVLADELVHGFLWSKVVDIFTIWTLSVPDTWSQVVECDQALALDVAEAILSKEASTSWP